MKKKDGVRTLDATGTQAHMVTQRPRAVSMVGRRTFGTARETDAHASQGWEKKEKARHAYTRARIRNSKKTNAHASQGGKKNGARQYESAHSEQQGTRTRTQRRGEKIKREARKGWEINVYARNAGRKKKKKG